MNGMSAASSVHQVQVALRRRKRSGRAGLGLAAATLLVVSSVPAVAITFCYDWPIYRASGKDGNRSNSRQSLEVWMKDNDYHLLHVVTKTDDAGNRLRQGDILIIGEAHAGFVGEVEGGEGLIDHFLQKTNETGRNWSPKELEDPVQANPTGAAFDRVLAEPLVRRRFKLADIFEWTHPMVNKPDGVNSQAIVINGITQTRKPYLNAAVAVWRKQPMSTIRVRAVDPHRGETPLDDTEITVYDGAQVVYRGKYLAAQEYLEFSIPTFRKSGGNANISIPDDEQRIKYHVRGTHVGHRTAYYPDPSSSKDFWYDGEVGSGGRPVENQPIVVRLEPQTSGGRYLLQDVVPDPYGQGHTREHPWATEHVELAENAYRYRYQPDDPTSRYGYPKEARFESVEFEPPPRELVPDQMYTFRITAQTTDPASRRAVSAYYYLPYSLGGGDGVELAGAAVDGRATLSVPAQQEELVVAEMVDFRVYQLTVAHFVYRWHDGVGGETETTPDVVASPGGTTGTTTDAESTASTAEVEPDRRDETPPQVVTDTGGKEPYAYSFTGRLVASHSGRCLDVEGGDQFGGGNGAKAHQWQCLDVRSQIWTMSTDARREFFQLRAGHSGKCLDIDQQATHNGARLHQWDCHGGDSQLWAIEQVGSGVWRLRSKLAGRCADIADVGLEDGAAAQLYDCHDGENQRWALNQGPVEPRNDATAGAGSLEGAWRYRITCGAQEWEGAAYLSRATDGTWVGKGDGPWDPGTVTLSKGVVRGREAKIELLPDAWIEPWLLAGDFEGGPGNELIDGTAQRSSGACAFFMDRNAGPAPDFDARGTWRYTTNCSAGTAAGSFTMEGGGDGRYAGRFVGPWEGVPGGAIWGGRSFGYELTFNFRPDGWNEHYVWKGKYTGGTLSGSVFWRGLPACGFAATR
jgi:hypothetical protein